MNRLLAISIVLFFGAMNAPAIRIDESVTKHTQAKQGLDFTLSAQRDAEGEVQVKLEVPHTGKLEHVVRVELWIMSEDPRKPVLVATLKPYDHEDSVTRVFLRLQSNLAEKAQLILIRKTEEDPTGYAIALRSYIQDRKPRDETTP